MISNTIIMTISTFMIIAFISMTTMYCYSDYDDHYHDYHHFHDYYHYHDDY